MAKFDISYIILMRASSFKWKNPAFHSRKARAPPQSLSLQVFVKLETLNISDAHSFIQGNTSHADLLALDELKDKR